MRAAAEGGIDRGSCLLPEFPGIAALIGVETLLFRCPSFRVRVGITTGLDGEAGGALNSLAGLVAPTVFPFLIIGFMLFATPLSFSSTFIEEGEKAGTGACGKARGVTIIVSVAGAVTTSFYRARPGR